MNRAYELALVGDDADFVIGVDEAGRGALAGPVGVAALCLDCDFTFADTTVRDSKKMSARARRTSFESMLNQEPIHHVELVSNEIVDDMNVLHATLYGMHKCVVSCIDQLKQKYELPDDVRICVLVDGNQRIPDLPAGIAQRTVEQGDFNCYTIAAASILAKESRDTFVTEVMHPEFPEYNFQKHKAYGTSEHLDAIRRFGVCTYHRKSFAPCS